MAIPEKISFKAFVVALVLGMVVLGAVFFVVKQRSQKPEIQGPPPLSKEEILQSLSVPGQENLFSLEEKRKILESLSASSETQYSLQEKTKILETLKAQNP